VTNNNVCPHCHGTGWALPPVECPICARADVLPNDCTLCDNTRQLADQCDCPKCRGTGQLVNPPTPK
jgi:DnaJ-class molecular chaperone